MSEQMSDAAGSRGSLHSFDSHTDEKLEAVPKDARRASRRYLIFPTEHNKPQSRIPDELA